MIRVFLWLVLGAGGASGAEAIGSYGNGCLLGGVTLGEEGPGFETIRRTRRRYYAHPATRDFLHAYGRAIDTVGFGRELVGDAEGFVVTAGRNRFRLDLARRGREIPHLS